MSGMGVAAATPISDPEVATILEHTAMHTAIALLAVEGIVLGVLLLGMWVSLVRRGVI